MLFGAGLPQRLREWTGERKRMPRHTVTDTWLHGRRGERLSLDCFAPRHFSRLGSRLA